MTLPARLVALAGTIATEAALLQSSGSPAEWALKNAGLLLAIAAGLVGYGALRNDVRGLRRDVDAKASNDTAKGLDGKLDMIHEDVRSLRDHLLGRAK